MVGVCARVRNACMCFCVCVCACIVCCYAVATVFAVHFFPLDHKISHKDVFICSAVGFQNKALRCVVLASREGLTACFSPFFFFFPSLNTGLLFVAIVCLTPLINKENKGSFILTLQFV